MALSPNSEPHHSNSCPWKLKLWKTNSNLLDNTDVGSDVSHGMSSLEVFMKKTCQNCFFFSKCLQARTKHYNTPSVVQWLLFQDAPAKLRISLPNGFLLPVARNSMVGRHWAMDIVEHP